MKYGPLLNHLSGLADSTVVLSYGQIEDLLGQKLPPTAYGDSWRQWWANTETHSQALAWMRAGWRVTRPDLVNKRVEFRRTAPTQEAEAQSGGLGGVPAQLPGGDQPIVLSRDHLTPSAVRMLEDAAEETQGDLSRAAVELINRASMARRRQLLDWFTENAPRTGTSSVALIREDRDAG